MLINRNELDLVAACLSDDDSFGEKLRVWESSASLLDMNFGALRVLPFLFSRIVKLDVSTTKLADLRKVNQYFWAKRKLQDRTIRSDLTPLMEGTRSVALKGLALESLAYAQDEIRPFSDVDLLMSRPDFRLVDKRAPKYNFNYVESTPTRSFDFFQHAKPLKGNHLDLDIHWTFFPLGQDAGYDDRIFERAAEKKEGSNWLIPSPTDALIHSILHGVRPDVVSPVRWLVDAHLLILRNEIDWSLFERESRNLGLQSELQSGLNYLAQFRKLEFTFSRRRSAFLSDWRFSHIAAKYSTKSDSLWAKRLLRLFGSDLVLVTRALKKDGLPSSRLFVLKTAIMQSVEELLEILANHSIRDVVFGRWSQKK